jgi:hypothetical protein
MGKFKVLGVFGNAMNKLKGAVARRVARLNNGGPALKFGDHHHRGVTRRWDKYDETCIRHR